MIRFLIINFYNLIFYRTVDFTNFIAKCLAKQPGDRPAADELLKVYHLVLNLKKTNLLKCFIMNIDILVYDLTVNTLFECK